MFTRCHIWFMIRLALALLPSSLVFSVSTVQSQEDTSNNSRQSLSHFSKDSLEEGCLSGDCLEEIGRYYFSTQDALYEGEFKGGLPQGRGSCTFGNGEHYTGEWFGGYFHGRGVLTLEDGTAVSGIWQDGRLVKTISSAELFQDPNTGNFNYSGGRTFAVLIGISTYPNLPELKYADDDAYKMYAHLRSPEGGAVPEDNFELLIDDQATQSKIAHALKKTAKRAGPLDRIVLFYSGHGLQDAFLPYDSDGFDRLLTHVEIRRILAESQCKSKLVFADACLSRQGFTDHERWHKPSSLLKVNERGTVVLFSSRMSETSLESDGLRQGVFSYFLFRGLTGAADLDMDQKVTIGELYRFVSRHVAEYTSGVQHPVLGGDLKDAAVIAQK